MSKANNLTIADIHNIRYENYEKTKDLSFDELVHKTAQKAQVFKKGLVKYAYQQDAVFEQNIAAEQPPEYKRKTQN